MRRTLQARTHAQQSNKAPWAFLFTLIEVLVVVFIIGISCRYLSSRCTRWAVTRRFMTRRGDSQASSVLCRSKRRWRAAILACDSSTQYGFLTYDPRHDKWETVEGDDLLRARQLPRGELPAAARRTRGIAAPTGRPRETLAAADRYSGQRRSHGIELKLQREDSDHEATITGNANGELEVKNVDAQSEATARVSR